MQCLYLWPNSWISKLLYDFFDCSTYITFFITITIPTRDGNGAGRGGAKGWGIRPCPAWFCLAPSSSRLHDGENFLTPSPPLGGPWSPALPYPVKLYFLLICPTTSTIFLMKHISLIKIYLILQLNLSHKIKSIFRKKLNNISKCLTRQSQKKKKNLIV